MYEFKIEYGSDHTDCSENVPFNQQIDGHEICSLTFKEGYLDSLGMWKWKGTLKQTFCSVEILHWIVNILMMCLVGIIKASFTRPFYLSN